MMKKEKKEETPQKEKKGKSPVGTQVPGRKED